MGKITGFILILVISLFAIRPFFAEGFFPMHDDTQVVRVDQMANALADGHFPVRWAKDLGYGFGYPIFNYYAPLPYYIGGFAQLLGFDALMGTKIMMIIGILLAGIFMYLLAREFWGNLGGIVSALFYMYTPYHAVEIYVRGAVGEFWAYSFLPLVFYGIWKIYRVGGWHPVFMSALGFAGVILSHNLSALMLIPFLIIAILIISYFAIKSRRLLVIAHTFIALFLGLCLSAFYWIPAFLEIGYTNVMSQVGEGANFTDHFVCWQQLWESNWGFAGSSPGCIADGLSFKIGKLHLIATIVLIVLLALKGLTNINKKLGMVIFSILGLLISVFLMLEVSSFIWEKISIMSYIQYPWRFLIFASFFTSVLSGALIYLLPQLFPKISKTLKYLIVAITFVMLLTPNLKLFEPQTIIAKTAQDYVNEYNVKWVTSKISDEYLFSWFIKPANYESVAKSRISYVQIMEDKTQILRFITVANTQQEIGINIAPFPAWRVYVDNIRADVIEGKNGFVVPIASGRHEVIAVYESTGVQKVANTITVAGLICIASGLILNKTGFNIYSRTKKIS